MHQEHSRCSSNLLLMTLILRNKKISCFIENTLVKVHLSLYHNFAAAFLKFLKMINWQIFKQNLFKFLTKFCETFRVITL